MEERNKDVSKDPNLVRAPGREPIRGRHRKRTIKRARQPPKTARELQQVRRIEFPSALRSTEAVHRLRGREMNESLATLSPCRIDPNAPRQRCISVRKGRNKTLISIRSPAMPINVGMSSRNDSPCSSIAPRFEIPRCGPFNSLPHGNSNVSPLLDAEAPHKHADQLLDQHISLPISQPNGLSRLLPRVNNVLAVRVFLDGVNPDLTAVGGRGRGFPDAVDFSADGCRSELEPTA